MVGANDPINAAFWRFIRAWGRYHEFIETGDDDVPAELDYIEKLATSYTEFSQYFVTRAGMADYIQAEKNAFYEEQT